MWMFMMLASGLVRAEIEVDSGDALRAALMGATGRVLLHEGVYDVGDVDVVGPVEVVGPATIVGRMSVQHSVWTDIVLSGSLITAGDVKLDRVVVIGRVEATQGSLTLDHGFFSENALDACLRVGPKASARVTRTTFANNASAAIIASGPLTVERSTFSNNREPAIRAWGGGSVRQSTIAGGVEGDVRMYADTYEQLAGAVVNEGLLLRAPALAPLGMYGGFAPTRPLIGPSGLDLFACQDDDARDFPPNGDCDVGAVERRPIALSLFEHEDGVLVANEDGRVLHGVRVGARWVGVLGDGESAVVHARGDVRAVAYEGEGARIVIGEREQSDWGEQEREPLSSALPPPSAASDNTPKVALKEEEREAEGKKRGCAATTSSNALGLMLALGRRRLASAHRAAER